MADRRTTAGIALIVAAVAGAEAGQFFPHDSYLVVFVVLVWAGLTLIVRGQRAHSRGPRVRSLEPGETYDRPVKLAVLPNVPIADVWRQRLQHEGIEASVGGTLLRSPSSPVALLVGEHDVDRARKLFPELGS